MDNRLTQGLFRMSAVLYARNNSNIISTKQIIRKVVEDALFQNSASEAMSLPSLIQYIIDNHALTFSEEEISSIIYDEKFSDVFDSYIENDCLQISLKQKRRVVLQSNANMKNLHDFVVEFVKIEELDETKIEVFYKFLYGVFTTNLEGYKQLLKEKILIKANDDSFSDEDKVIINKFLDWDNHEKNVAIYNLASYALEYCLLTNQQGMSLDVNILKNKYLYLDANILFRAIGINGDDRRLRTEQFLSQFSKVQQKLYITKETDHEFKETLDYYTEKIKRSTTPTVKVNPKVYVETVNIDGFYKCYYKWRINRSDTSIDTFKVFLLAKYDDLLKRFKIEIDTIKPYDEEKQLDCIKEYASSIRTYNEDKSYSAAEIDARNIIWIENRRNGQNDDLYQVKHFLVSSDQHLRRWDYNRNSNDIPIVMLPSQWLSLILRYMERTDNDYKSFVYFLNMKVTHSVLSEEQLLYVIEGISEIVTDVTQQSNLVKTFIKEDFNKITQGISNEEIQEEAKLYAESKYEKRIKTLKDESNKKDRRIEMLVADNSEKGKRITELESINRKSAVDVENLKIQMSEIDNELERRKDYDDIKEENKRYRLRKWKTLRCLVLGVSALIWCSSFVLCFVATESNYNYVSIILNWIAGMDENRSDIAKQILFWLYPTIGVFLIYCFLGVLFVKNEEEKKNWYKVVFHNIKSKIGL